MDIIKSAALDAGVSWEPAGRTSHVALRAPAESLLGHGFPVVLGHPCRFEQIVTAGTAIAEGHQATYCFIECVLPDAHELGNRIRSRPRLRSQMVDYGVSSPDAPAGATRADLVRDRGAAVFDTKYPRTPWLQVDTRQPPERCLADALAYIEERSRACA